jgi:hypothetical protein
MHYYSIPSEFLKLMANLPFLSKRGHRCRLGTGASDFRYAESPEQLEQAAKRIVWMVSVFRSNQAHG